MVDISFSHNFKHNIKKIKHQKIKDKVSKQIHKIINSPEIGKPLQHRRKGTREVHIKPYRLSYKYIKEENKIILLAFYHKDEQ